jgi:hypothetical protein
MNGFELICADVESGGESVLPNPCCRGFGDKAGGATVFRPNFQPAVPAVDHINLCSGFNICDELGVGSRGAEDPRCLYDFVAFPSR